MGWWWASVLGTVLLDLLRWGYHLVAQDGGRFARTALDTRVVAYPLWVAGSVLIVVAAIRSVRVVRRITRAQQQAGRRLSSAGRC